MTDPEKLKILNKYYNYDKEIRGKFLIQANWNEDFLEQIVSKLLIEKDEKLKREVVISLLRKTSYNTKISIFTRLVKEFLPEYDLEKYNIPKELEQTKDIRNMFAHSVMDLRDKFLDSNPEDVVQYEIKKDGKTVYKKFTKKKLKEYVDLVFKLTNDLTEIDVYLEERSQRVVDSKKP